MLYDIIVVGAGPAGLTAGANAANRGLKTLILEGQGIAGGQPATFYPKKLIIDHPGFPKGVTGKELARRLYEQAIHSKAVIRLNEPVIDIRLKQKIKKVRTRRNKYEGKRLILATGLHNIPRHHRALKDNTDRNIYHYVKEPRIFRNKHILVIGGGDTAFDRANMLAKTARSVSILIREKYAKAKKSSVDKAKENQIRIMLNTDLMRYQKDRTAILMQKKRFNMKFDAIIVSIGFIPSLEVLTKAGLSKTRSGLIKVNDKMETSVKGVFAAGDLVGEVKLIATACSEGIVAAVNTFNSIKKPYWLNN